MPINRLVKNAAFPQIGVLRKGDKKTDEKRPGKNLTYFRFVTEDASAAAAFASAYGEEPRDINIMLPFKTAAENLDWWMEHWVAGGLKKRCDGDIIVLHQRDDGSYSTKPQACLGNCDLCSEVGRLSVIIPELGRLALVTVLTTSIHDCMELNRNLTAYEAMRGDLRGIPFVLRRRPRKISKPINGKRVRMEEWLLTIETDESWVQMQLSEMKRLALPEGVSVNDDEDTIEADYDVVDYNPPVAPYDEPSEEPESGFPPAHWSQDPANRAKLEKALTKKGIVIEYLFKACGVENWDDMSRFEDEGKAAFDLAVALWEKEKAQPEAA